MKVFEELGGEIERRWAGVEHSWEAFPGVVTGALADARPALAGVRALDVVEWVLSAASLPEQQDVHAIFAEPPVSVFDSPHFHIQALCWRRGTTAIHEHGFVGGFIVLEGINLHTCYRFEPRERISERLQIGDVRLERAELLRAGDIVAITPELRHNVFHLDAPAATLVIRSQPDRKGPKLDYFYPSLAFDPFDVDPTILRRTQVLRLLLHTEHERHDSLASELLGRCDLAMAWDVLEQSCNEIADPARVAALVDVARRRHGSVIDELVAVIDEQRRMQQLIGIHANEPDAQLRWFLALLHSVPCRETMLQLVRERDPGADPRVQIRGWAERLSDDERIGVDLQDPVNALILDAALDGCTQTQLLERLATRFDPASVAGQTEAVLEHCRRLRRSLLAPVFAGLADPSELRLPSSTATALRS